MSADSLSILWLTIRIATAATFFVGIPGIAIGYLLARYDFRGKSLVSALTGLPLVLPPTAVGLLLLRLFAFDGPLNAMGIDLDVLLTWRAAVVASAVMSLPLVVRTARVAFDGVDPRLESMSRTLGHGRMRTLFGTTLPLARRGLIAALILGFTRALGEFGATVTVAGNIPGKTQTLASGISAAQQAGDDARATMLMSVALVLGFAAILSAEHLSRRRGESSAR